jgi:uncharacterized protein (DUF433 family)
MRCSGRVLYFAGAAEVFDLDWMPYIAVDPQVLHGAVCFRGTRIPVSVVLDNLAANEPVARILEQYPSLKAEHIPAALAYAAELARERVVSVPA